MFSKFIIIHFVHCNCDWLYISLYAFTVYNRNAATSKSVVWLIMCFLNLKGNVLPRTGHEGSKGK